MTDNLQALRALDFEPLKNQPFIIQFTPEVKLPADLIEVKETENYLHGDRTPFFIVFRTEQKDRFYPQGIYDVVHPTKGLISIFLVPLGPDAKGMRYEAVFS